MLGSVIPKRWIVSFALVGLLAITVSSFSTVWAAPNGAGTTVGTTGPTVPTATPVPTATATATPVPTATPTGTSAQTLNGGRIAPETATIQSSGSLTLQAIPQTADGVYRPGLAGVTYAWSATGGTVSPTTGGTTVFTASSGTSSATITVVMSQASVPNVVRSATVTVRSAAATATPRPAAVNPPGPTPVLPTPAAGVEQGVVSPAEGGTLSAQGGAVSVEVPANAFTGAFRGVQVVPVVPTAAEVPPPSGAFRVGSRVVNIVWTDDAGNPLTNVVLDRPVRVCVAFTDADAAASAGGAFDLQLMRYANPPGEWRTLNTTVDTKNKKLCGYTSRFSLFAVGIAAAPTGAVPGVVLPATGDYAPSSGLVMSLVGVGVVFVGFGLVALRRRKTKT